MAWHMPKELMNNIPLSEEIVRQKFEKCGYKILEYTYKNNTTRMKGSREVCQSCGRSTSNYERKVKRWLIDNKIDFIQQKRFEDCRDKKTLPFDFLFT